MAKIMLIDGNSIINRAFFGIPLLTNKEGEYTNAVYGFFNIFFKFLQEEKPDNIAIAFDLPKPTFRHEMFSEYKGTRKTMQPELRPQIPMLKEILKKMNISIYELVGYEADDILGTMAVECGEKGYDVSLISGDRDLLQIATDKIKIMIPKTKGGKTIVESYYQKDVEQLYGVTPTEFIDIKALMGDASDNIPGVPGIGVKTAEKIIVEYRSIENAIENAELVKPKKASENLQLFKEQAILSKALATICKTVPIALDLEKTAFDSKSMFNVNAFVEFKRNEFKTFYKYFNEVETENTDKSENTKLKNEDNLNKLDTSKIKVFNTAQTISDEIANIIKVKSATYRILYDNDFLLGLSICYKDNFTFLSSSSFNNGEFLELVKPFFESEVEKITLDVKKDFVFLSKYKIDIVNVVFDVMLGAYILNASSDSYNYDDISLDILDEIQPSYDEFFGKGKSKVQLELLDSSNMSNFAVNECFVIDKLYKVISEKIEENGFHSLYYDLEFPLLFVLKDMEICGIKVDEKALFEYGEMLDGKIEILTKDIYEEAGEEFNINSPKQLGEILFEKLEIQGSKKTKTGYSTAADVLEKLAPQYKIVKDVLEYRTYAKLKSTYVDGLIKVIDKKTGKIHTTFNQTVTTTGRISSTEPNLQNIPIRLEIGKQIRKVFVPESEEYTFADADYSQIELRILAHMANDETFINAFNSGEDIHRLTASQVLKIPLEEVTPSQRSSAKAINFGIVYGISAFSLSGDLNISVKEAGAYIESYFEKYPSVKNYLDYTIKVAKENGYASTIMGRKRNIPEINSQNFNERSFGERVAMNMPVQGTAADIIKVAMIKVHKRLKDENLSSRLLLQVHDELLIEVKKGEEESVKFILEQEMRNAENLKVILESEVKFGENWLEAH